MHKEMQQTGAKRYDHLHSQGFHIDAQAPRFAKLIQDKGSRKGNHRKKTFISFFFFSFSFLIFFLFFFLLFLLGARGRRSGTKSAPFCVFLVDGVWLMLW